VFSPFFEAENLLILVRRNQNILFMSDVKLEIRIYDTNTIGWEVYLEDVSEQRKIKKWMHPTIGQNYFWKEWDRFPVHDGELDVHVVCSGYGGEVRCVVRIDNARPNDSNSFIVLSEDDITHKSFPV
jgi:hypothetical protein